MFIFFPVYLIYYIYLYFGMKKKQRKFEVPNEMKIKICKNFHLIENKKNTFGALKSGFVAFKYAIHLMHAYDIDI